MTNYEKFIEDIDLEQTAKLMATNFNCRECKARFLCEKRVQLSKETGKLCMSCIDICRTWLKMEVTK